MGRAVSDAQLKATIEAVELHRGNRKLAARELGISAQTVMNRLETAAKRGLCVIVKGGARGSGLGAEEEKTAAANSDAQIEPNVGRLERVQPVATRHVNPPDVVDRLFNEHLAWAEGVGLYFRKKRKLPTTVSDDELQQAARIGLWEAARRFDESRGYTFKTYALVVLHGRMIDDIRENDPVSRTSRKLRTARIAMEEQLGPTATREDVQQALGWNDQKFNASFHEAPESLDRKVAQAAATKPEKEVTLLDLLAADAEEFPLDKIARVQELLRGLDPDAFCVVYLYHWKNQTMKAIGAVLELSESRVSQLHSEICQRIRAQGKEQFIARAA